MDKDTITRIANKLHTARLTAAAVQQFGSSIAGFNRKDAYTIQETGIGLRVPSRFSEWKRGQAQKNTQAKNLLTEARGLKLVA